MIADGKLTMFYVYLLDGQVEEVSAANGFRQTQEHLLILHGEQQVLASFRRCDVYLVSRDRVPPPGGS